jgi:Asp-tRNA(Asn)/Glu-tRNA(Gln) amidotransferase A subunit family amidase
MISLTEVQRRIAKGELTPDAAITQSLQSIEAHDKTFGAFVRHSKSARAQSTGALRGIAVGIKDIIDTADFPTEMGSSIYRGWQPRADAAVVMMLKRAGATIVGKTTTTAFASMDPTATLNPRNTDYTPGGSSAGSAAAVAAGMIPLALGTQTAGSVIRPAAFCGVAAVKPSFRMLPTVGVKTYAWTLDTVGLFAAATADLAQALAAMTGRGELSNISRPSPPRIAVVRQTFAGAAEPSGEKGLQVAIAAAEGAGATVGILDLPDIFAEAWRIQPTIQEFEAHHALAWEYRTRYEAMAPLVRGKLDETVGLKPSDYDQARGIARRARKTLSDIFSDVDVLLTFSASGAAPKGLASTGDPRFNRLWTLMGVPCVNVPAWITEAGLPIGVQVIARFGNDAGALSAAQFLEDALRRR